jgi:PAS domain-containing protein
MGDNDSVLQAVVDSLPDVIFYKDLDGVYSAGNKAWGELLGRPVGELLGKTDADLFPAAVASGFRALLADGAPDGSPPAAAD